MRKIRATVAILVCAAVGFPVLPAHAAAEHTRKTNERVPIEYVVFVPCANDGAGETVVLSGTAHILEHVVIDEGEEPAPHVLYRTQISLSGVGESTGETYRAVVFELDEYTERGDEDTPYQRTFIEHLRLVGQSSGTVFVVRSISHHTVSEAGRVTASFTFETVSCG